MEPLGVLTIDARVKPSMSVQRADVAAALCARRACPTRSITGARVNGCDDNVAAAVERGV